MKKVFLFIILVLPSILWAESTAACLDLNGQMQAFWYCKDPTTGQYQGQTPYPTEDRYGNIINYQIANDYCIAHY